MFVFLTLGFEARASVDQDSPMPRQAASACQLFSSLSSFMWRSPFATPADFHLEAFHGWLYKNAIKELAQKTRFRVLDIRIDGVLPLTIQGSFQVNYKVYYRDGALSEYVRMLPLLEVSHSVIWTQDLKGDEIRSLQKVKYASALMAEIDKEEVYIQMGRNPRKAFGMTSHEWEIVKDIHRKFGR